NSKEVKPIFIAVYKSQKPKSIIRFWAFTFILSIKSNAVINLS
ncbi:MAG: hypothetical protein ACI8P3_004504, partial [Saprospiraceae bacterium]